MKISFLRSGEKKEFLKGLKSGFGIDRLNYLLISSGKDRIYGFSGNLSKEEIFLLSDLANVEIVGLYLANLAYDLRLGFDATNILSNDIKINTVEIDEASFRKWMKGDDLDAKIPKGIFVIKHKNDFLGCGKSNGEKIFNYVPKEKRATRA